MQTHGLFVTGENHFVDFVASGENTCFVLMEQQLVLVRLGSCHWLESNRRLLLRGLELLI